MPTTMVRVSKDDLRTINYVAEGMGTTHAEAIRSIIDFANLGEAGKKFLRECKEEAEKIRALRQRRLPSE